MREKHFVLGWLTATFTAQLGSGHKELTLHEQPGSTAPAFATRLYSPGFRNQALQYRIVLYHIVIYRINIVSLYCVACIIFYYSISISYVFQFLYVLYCTYYIVQKRNKGKGERQKGRERERERGRDPK